MNPEDDQLQRIEDWMVKLRASLDEQVKLGLESKSEATESSIKEEWLLNKIAVLQVGCEDLGKELRALKGMVLSNDT